MIKQRIEQYEGNLVRIITNDDYELLDYYEYNPEMGELYLSAYDIHMHENDVEAICIVEDNEIVYSKKATRPFRKIKHHIC